MIANQDSSINSASNPAARGDVVVIYCSGLGAVTPLVADGTASPFAPVAQTTNLVSVTIALLRSCTVRGSNTRTGKPLPSQRDSTRRHRARRPSARDGHRCRHCEPNCHHGGEVMRASVLFAFAAITFSTRVSWTQNQPDSATRAAIAGFNKSGMTINCWFGEPSNCWRNEGASAEDDWNNYRAFGAGRNHYRGRSHCRPLHYR